MPKAKSCPICGSTKIDSFFTLNDVPVFCNVLWQSREQAIDAARGTIELGFCAACGHIYNYAFDPALPAYSPAYENALTYSPRFRRYSQELVQHLHQRYQLTDKTIIDIGCGKGDFLKQICDIGGSRGIGFDPSYQADQTDLDAGENLTFIQDLYNEKYSDYVADLICCRHVLEHIQKPGEFVEMVTRASRGANTTLFFEVPNAAFTIKDMAIWDLIYEHCSYFSFQSLAYLFRIHGYDIRNLESTFGDQFLIVEAVHADNTKPQAPLAVKSTQKLQDKIELFARNYAQKFSQWKNILSDRREKRQQGVVWGAGSKGVSFLMQMRQTTDISVAVDVNFRKHGKFMAGSGVQITAPETLKTLQPDFVIIMNPIYTDEIISQLKKLGVQADVYVDDAHIIHSPTKALQEQAV